MQKKNLEPSNIELSSQMISSVKASRQRYSAYLEEQKNIKEKSKKNDQIEILNCRTRGCYVKEGMIVESLLEC